MNNNISSRDPRQRAMQQRHLQTQQHNQQQVQQPMNQPQNHYHPQHHQQPVQHHHPSPHQQSVLPPGPPQQGRGPGRGRGPPNMGRGIGRGRFPMHPNNRGRGASMHMSPPPQNHFGNNLPGHPMHQQGRSPPGMGRGGPVMGRGMQQGMSVIRQLRPPPPPPPNPGRMPNRGPPPALFAAVGNSGFLPPNRTNLPPPPPPQQLGFVGGRGGLPPPPPPPPRPPVQGGNFAIRPPLPRQQFQQRPPQVPVPPLRPPQKQQTFQNLAISHGPNQPKQPHSQALQTQATPGLNNNRTAQVDPTSYTENQIDQAWTEYSPATGAKYYFNSILKTSTYEKPKYLAEKEKLEAAAKFTASTSNSTWNEYTDAATGKKYYSNGVTTTWEKPSDYISPSAIVAQSMEAEAAAAASPVPTPGSSNNKKRKRSDKETPFHNSAEAVAAFKGLLLAKGVSPTHKWNEVVKMCSSDPRWEDCEEVLTTGERKQAMAEYQTKRANELRDQERQERARAKDAFVQLLSEVIPKIDNFSLWKSRFSDIRDSISKDDRFYAVSDEEARESLFLDFCEELRKHDERKKRNQKRESKDAFLSFLKEKQDAEILVFSSTWTSFLSSLDDADKADSRFKTSSHMSDSDRQLYFADFILELQAVEDDKRRRIRDARRRAEKAQRDAYRDCLERIAAEGKLTPSSHWRDIERHVTLDGSYKFVQEQDQTLPQELFDDFIDEWYAVYRRERQFLSQLVHPSSSREILVTPATKYDEFVKALLEEAKLSPQDLAEARRIVQTEEPLSSARVYFNDLVERARERTIPLRRRSHGSRRGSHHNESSSEDEGEIKEDGEEDEEANRRLVKDEHAIQQQVDKAEEHPREGDVAVGGGQEKVEKTKEDPANRKNQESVDSGEEEDITTHEVDSEQ